MVVPVHDSPARSCAGQPVKGKTELGALQGLSVVVVVVAVKVRVVRLVEVVTVLVKSTVLVAGRVLVDMTVVPLVEVTVVDPVALAVDVIVEAMHSGHSRQIA